MQCTEYSKIWLDLTFAALRSYSFPSVSRRSSNYRITLRSRSTFQNLEGTMWLAKLGKRMLSSVELAFVERDEIRAPLKTPAWEAMRLHTYIKKLRTFKNWKTNFNKKHYPKSSKLSRAETDIKTGLSQKISVSLRDSFTIPEEKIPAECYITYTKSGFYLTATFQFQKNLLWLS